MFLTLISLLCFIKCFFFDEKFQNQLRVFEISLDNVGKTACIVVDFGDESDYGYYGNPITCRIRFPMLNNSYVKDLNTDTKVINTMHEYR